MKIVVYIILAAVLLILYIRFLEGTTVFLPTRQLTWTPREVGLFYEDLTLETPDGLKINAWFVPSAPGSSTVLFFHGNAGNISDRVEKLVLFHDLGLNIMIIDYRGYGKSEGRPSEKGVYLDARAAYDHLVSRYKSDPQRIIIYGTSLGGAVAVDLAARRPAGALVLESTFTSAADMSKVIFPLAPPFLLNIKLDSIRKIENITIPKLFIHSPDDEIVPFALGRKLFAAAPEPKRFVKIHGAHNEAVIFSEGKYLQELRGFLQDNGLLEPKP